MRSNRKLLFGLALIVAAICLWQIMTRMGSSQRVATTATPLPHPANGAAPPGSANGGMARATQNIPAGSLIAPGMFDMAPKKAGQSTAGFITDNSQVLGYITRVGLNKGDLMRPEDFVGNISQVGIAGALRPGFRAMVIPIADKPTLHDLVRIGNYVDIYGAFDGQEARSVVQNVRVMAVDVTANDFPPENAGMRGSFKATPPGNVTPGTPPPAPDAKPTPEPTPPPAPAAALTLEVTPPQAAALLLMQASGAKFDFLLRPATPDEGLTLVSGTGTAPAVEDVPVSVTKPQIAPYSSRLKEAASRPTSPAPSRPVRESRPSRRSFFGPPLPSPVVPTMGTTTVAPAQVPVASTYDIPIYADGHLVRTDTVRNPQQ